MFRTFSENVKCFMARDRKDFIIRARGTSQEICHNLVRLIYRANHESALHWKSELAGLMSSSICGEYKVRKLPTNYYLSDITKVDEITINDNALEALCEIVKSEPYGTYTNYPLETIKVKLQDFINSIPTSSKGISLAELKSIIDKSL